MGASGFSPRSGILFAAVAAAAFFGIANGVRAQTAPLSGQVSSAAEPAMEGVLIGAKKAGSTVTTVVVSDNKGHYSFPAGRLSPGHYGLWIRAVGYDLQGPKEVDIPATGGATADIKLEKTKDLEKQLNNAEWIMSVPAADKEKSFLTSCVGCHNLQRPLFSKHTAEEFQELFKRMQTYSSGSTPEHFQLLFVDGERVRVRPEEAERTKPHAELLARVNLSTGPRSYPLKTLPRPTGRATHVIYTTYDLPRPIAEPHDVVLTPDGHAWYSDFGSPVVGEVDPVSGKVMEYPLPLLKPKLPTGSLNLAVDPKGELWIAMMMQGALAKIDPKTKKITPYPFPEQTTSTYASMVSPQHSDVDGVVWTGDQSTHTLYKFHTDTEKYEKMGIATDPSGKQITGYGMPTDSHNNPWLLEYRNTHIGKVDAKTNVTTIYATPFARSRPRRGRVDAQDNLWFGEYQGNAIAMFDPKTERFTEWKLPETWGNPYDAEADRNGEVWAGSMLTDRVSRLNPKTGEFVEYLAPGQFTNIRRVFVDNKAARPGLWFGDNHGASVVHLEPLD
ncbi:MAG TPA: carboxypeptidase regulatory-like domain-containing protein [Xanthobacteraceae bacterium]|nr:carboxypeptidase regulatory-like domain-containing protein [Xanthobacteraceae bacterium]